MIKPLRLLLCAALLLLSACTASRPVNSALQAEPEYFVPPVAYRSTPPLRRSLLVATAAGALPQCRKLVRQRPG